MFRSLYTAASGMQAQQTNLDTIANNLANSSTAGFRSRRMQFQDLIYQSMVMPGAAASQQTTVATGLQIGLGTRSSALACAFRRNRSFFSNEYMLRTMSNRFSRFGQSTAVRSLSQSNFSSSRL